MWDPGRPKKGLQTAVSGPEPVRDAFRLLPRNQGVSGLKPDWGRESFLDSPTGASQDDDHRSHAAP
jgi:hypothetical protein